MKRFVAVAAILLATTAAHAGDTYSFDIGGRTVTIDAPSDCRSTDCVSVSIPGVYEQNPKRNRREKDRDGRDGKSSPKLDPARPAEPDVASRPAPAAPPAAVTVTPAPLASPTPVPAATAATNPASPPLAPPANTAANTPPAIETAKPAPSTVIANAPAESVARPVTGAPAASPLGVWMTEKKEGKVRIEACGNNLCGYSVDKKTEANGDKVLINMKPGDSKWAGKIYDPNSGSTYDSTIALKGSDTLRVQGCAFGGMFCGGQTWTRVN